MSDQDQATHLAQIADQWQYEHFGFPTCLTLDPNNAVVVFGRPQRGTTQIDGPEDARISYESERIQAVFYQRDPVDDLAPPLDTKPNQPRGRWVLTDRFFVEHIGTMYQMPNRDLLALQEGKISQSIDGGRTWTPVDGARGPNKDHGLNVLGVLDSGRWLALTISNAFTAKTGHHEEVGMRGGCPIMKICGYHYGMRVHIWYSDDQGQTWQGGEICNGPLRWATAMGKGFIEDPPGTVTVPIFGCVTEEEADAYASSNGVLRSTDGGQT